MLNKKPITGSQIQAAQITAQKSHEHELRLVIAGFRDAIEKCSESFLGGTYLSHSQQIEIIQNRALRKTRAQAAEALEEMHHRADEIMAEIDFQHHDAMIRLDIEHKARMKAILSDWWISLTIAQRVAWFTAWNDFNYRWWAQEGKSEFERSVFAFMDSLPHLHSFISPNADMTIEFNGEVAHGQAH